MAAAITPDLLEAATGCTPALAKIHAPHLAEAAHRFGIDAGPPERLAMWLAQLAHESGAFAHAAEVWGPTPAQERYERDMRAPWPQSPAEAKSDTFARNRLAYRLGNSEPGDGFRYRGHGHIQITGRGNHAAAREGLIGAGYSDVPAFEAEPERLTEPRWAAASAGWYWYSRRLDAPADAGDLEAVTRAINGGLNGIEDRRRRWHRAFQAVSAAGGATAPPPAPEKPRSEAPVPAAPHPQITTEWDLQQQPQPEPNMPAPLIAAAAAPFLNAAFAAVLDAAPTLIDMFAGQSKSAQRNSEAVKVAVGVAKEALQVRNEQELVERLQTDPTARVAVREAVERNWFEIHKAVEASRAEARKFVAEYSARQDVRTVAGRFTFVELLSLIFVVGCVFALGLLIWGDKIGKETVGNIAMVALVASIVGVREFWFGSSDGSRRKDDLISERKDTP